MDVDRRNPYLILGLPYGASAEDAQRAFARKVRSVRRNDSSLFTVEDLTWALHAIEHVVEEASASVDFFRVPANRATLAAPRPGELFAPTTSALARRSPATERRDLEGLGIEAAHQVAVELLANADPTEVGNPYAQSFDEGGTSVPTAP